MSPSPFQREWGPFVETILTVIKTGRQQGRNAFSFLGATVESRLAHQPTPSLLRGV
jgi:hypothetical protein